MEYVCVPAIVIICYIIGEVYKCLIKKDKDKYKYIPAVVGISGGILGLISYFISPEILLNIKSPIVAIAVGIVSGLASTGGNQIIKQLITSEDQNFKNN